MFSYLKIYIFSNIVSLASWKIPINIYKSFRLWCFLYENCKCTKQTPEKSQFYFHFASKQGDFDNYLDKNLNKEQKRTKK